MESYILGLDEKALVALDAAVGEKGKVEVKVDGVGYELTRELFGVETVTETVYVEEYTPNVIEPSFGIGRVLYCLLEHSWYVRDGDESRNVGVRVECMLSICVMLTCEMHTRALSGLLLPDHYRTGKGAARAYQQQRAVHTASQ